MRISKMGLGSGLFFLALNIAISPAYGVQRGTAQTQVPAAIPAADPVVAGAEQLIRDGKYQEAYDQLAPLQGAPPADPRFSYLLGRAALGTNRPQEAKAHFQRSVDQEPGLIAAHLGLGRAYFALGNYAESKYEFETVLRFDNLPPDLLTQTEIYDGAAEQYLEDDKRLTGFGYVEVGIGHYWEHLINDTDEHDDDDSDERRDPFYNGRGGVGVDYIISESYTLDGSLDYRFRHYDNPDARNDSDWRWNGVLGRTSGNSNLGLGARGRVSFRGNGQYRNDYGVYGNFRYNLNPANQLRFEADGWRRRYPEGNLRNRSRDTAEAILEWNHSFGEGHLTLSLLGNGGYEWRHSGAPYGNASFWRAAATLNFVLSDRIDGFFGADWRRRGFNEDRADFDPDFNEIQLSARSDNIYNVWGGLVWEFVRSWSLRPEFLYQREVSNIPLNNYSSTAVWVNVRKQF